MKFFTSNELQWRLCRTIVQAIFGFLVANIDTIISGLTISPTAKTMIVGLVMAILSPIMAEIGKNSEGDN